jgi:ORF6N domain
VGRIAGADVAQTFEAGGYDGVAMSDALAIQVERRILLIRGQKVMLDYDLAELYGVETGLLNRAVKRNAERFPEDFMFQLMAKEWETLKCQIGMSNDDAAVGKAAQFEGRGGRRRPPYAFSEQGVAMLSSVLRSERAVKVNIAIMRTFVRLREMLLSNAELAQKLAELEEKYDAQFRMVFDAIRELMAVEEAPKRRIGFKGDDQP